MRKVKITRRRVVIAAFLLLALVLLPDCQSVRPAIAPSGPAVKVLTWNVNFGMPGAERAAQVILDADADVVVLQETNESWQRLLTPQLKQRYPYSDQEWNREFLQQIDNAALRFAHRASSLSRSSIHGETNADRGWNFRGSRP